MIRLSYLIACRKHINQFHHVEWLRNVHIINGHISACDGVTALFIHDKSLTKLQLAIPAIAIDELEYHFNHPLFKNTDFTKVFIDIFQNQNGYFLTYKDISVKFHKQSAASSILDADIERPEIATVFPFVDLEILKNFKDSFGCLFDIANISSVALIPSGPSGPIYVDFSKNVHGIIMPVKQDERENLLNLIQSHYYK